MGVAPIFAIKRRRLWFVVPVLGVHLAMLHGLVRTSTLESNPETGQPLLEVHLITAPDHTPVALAPARFNEASPPQAPPLDGRKPVVALTTQPHMLNLSSVPLQAAASVVHIMQTGAASVSPADAPSEPAAVTATGVPAAGSTGPAAPLLPGSGGAAGAPSAALMAAMGQKSMAIGVVCPTQVKPVMPRRAEREGLQGVVNARITLQAGRVTQVEIVSAQPRGVFDAAVRNAIEQYRCESPADVAVVTTQLFEFNAAPLP
jgi:protein TonB